VPKNVSVMNDSQVQQQIQQMVSFIRQEADDKANEIRVKAEEDFNIRKLSAVEAAREKIRAEYEKKSKQIDVNRKMFVARLASCGNVPDATPWRMSSHFVAALLTFPPPVSLSLHISLSPLPLSYSSVPVIISAQSTESNAARLEVLKARDGVLREVYEEADAALATLAKENPDGYTALLSSMILQGLIKLRDEEVMVRCREVDLETVRDVLPSVSADYSSKTGKHLTVTVDAKTFLTENCTGGVSLLSEGGRILVENTFESRLDIAYSQNLPAIRKLLFPAA
jgi:V-type H+-transporting ATPase subunit E